MKSSSPIISAVVFGVSVILLLVFGLGSSSPYEEREDSASERDLAVEMEPLADLLEERFSGTQRFQGLALDPPKPVLAAYRKSAEVALSGLIVDEAGTTVAGVDLLWMSLEEGEEELRTSTEEDGRFRFEFAPPELTEAWSAVWILHPTHYVEVIVLGPGENPSSVFGKMRRLQQAPTFTAVVLDVNGEPVSGALVEQTFALGAGKFEARSGKDQDSVRERAFRRFRNTARTDSSGEALLVPVNIDSMLSARLDDACSEPWEGSSEGAVEMTLKETFAVLGSVRGGFGSETWVRCESVTFGEVTQLREFLVEESGEWGPGFLPLLDVDEYVFTLRGEVAASQVRVSREEVSDRMIINLDSVRGVAVELLVLDPHEAPLEAATATVHWKQEGSWQSVSATSDEVGIARARGVPEGNSYARIHRAGHVSKMIGPFEVVLDMDPIEVRLELAGQITGRCLRDGDLPWVMSFILVFSSSDYSPKGLVQWVIYLCRRRYIHRLEVYLGL